MKNLIFLFLLCAGCIRLNFDETLASPLVMVSRTPTPSFEEVRSFVQYGDLVYVAAGSGGLLVYRTVGDRMQPVPSLSLTNLYANELAPAFIRTVEIVEGRNSTNLIFAFDTVAGGGIGAMEISPAYTKPLGSLTAFEGMRIRRTHSRPDPDGGFIILAANEYAGVISCRLTIQSNNLFDQQSLASLAGYVALQGLGGAALPFQVLQPPGAQASTVTNFEGLLGLFQKDPKGALSIASNLPFLNDAQRRQLEEGAQRLGILTNSNILAQAARIASDIIPAQAASQAAQFLRDPTLAGALGLGGNAPEAGLQSALPPPPEALTPPRDENYYLSNLNSYTNFTATTDTLHSSNFNPFATARPIKDAGAEIDSTASAFGRQFSGGDQDILKDRLRTLTSGEQNAVFEALFSQSDLLTRLIPLLETSGFNPRQLYQIWQEGRINEIIDKLDAALLADMIKLLPQTRIEAKLTVESTNVQLAHIRNMSADARSLYLALGKDGFSVIDRATGQVQAEVKREFSEVEAVIPFTAYGKAYLAVADRLDGLSVYVRGKNDGPAALAARLNLVGEGMGLYAQDNLLWVADGSNGVLAVRFMRDKSLRIEGEFFEKQGIARHISTARPREALVSYGADGFVRLRFTNITAEDERPAPTNRQQQTTLAQKTLEWNNTSPFFRFLRRLLL